MQITLIRNCLINSEHHDAGETIDVAEELGRTLVTMKRAVEGWPEDAPSNDGQTEPVKTEPVIEPEVAAVEPASEKAVMPTATKKTI